MLRRTRFGRRTYFLGRILEIVHNEQESSPLSWERRTYFGTTYAFFIRLGTRPGFLAGFWRVFGELGTSSGKSFIKN